MKIQWRVCRANTKIFLPQLPMHFDLELIYISLAGFEVYQSRGLFNNKQPYPNVFNIGWLFVLNCVANCLWIIAWLL